MITIQEWTTMSGKEQTLWLEDNAALNRYSESQRGVVHGVGVNDAHYLTQPNIDGKKVMCPAYGAWAAMLKRACSSKYHAKRPTYSVVKVCDEWQSFMSFRRWWIENQVDDWHIDKDILSSAGIYSPATCIFVPAWLNSFTLDSGSLRGVYPIGVSFHKGTGRFQAGCRNPMSKKREHLGLFKTPEAAHTAWLNRKLELSIELKHRMDEIDMRIYPQVIEIINNAK